MPKFIFQGKNKKKETAPNTQKIIKKKWNCSKYFKKYIKKRNCAKYTKIILIKKWNGSKYTKNDIKN